MPRLRNRTWALLAFAVGTLLSFLHCWPLVTVRGSVPSTSPSALREDVLMNMWHLHWFQEVLKHPQNPFATSLIAAPTGTTFYWHDLGFMKSLPGAILAWMIGHGAALNWMTFSTFVLAYFTAW